MTSPPETGRRIPASFRRNPLLLIHGLVIQRRWLRSLLTPQRRRSGHRRQAARCRHCHQILSFGTIVCQFSCLVMKDAGKRLTISPFRHLLFLSAEPFSVRQLFPVVFPTVSGRRPSIEGHFSASGVLPVQHVSESEFLCNPQNVFAVHTLVVHLIHQLSCQEESCTFPHGFPDQIMNHSRPLQLLPLPLSFRIPVTDPAGSAF